MNKFHGFEPRDGSFAHLLDGKPFGFDLQGEQMRCPVCRAVFGRTRSAMKSVSVFVFVPNGRPRGIQVELLVCDSNHPAVEEDCGFVVPADFGGTQRRELARSRIAYLKMCRSSGFSPHRREEAV